MRLRDSHGYSDETSGPWPRRTIGAPESRSRPCRPCSTCSPRPSPRTATGRHSASASTMARPRRWSYRELDRRSRIAAWRLRALGLAPGDRLLTWSPSTPELPATYFGAMRAGLILVPLDLRMSPDAVKGIVAASGARHLILGTGRDAPDPREAGLDRFPTTTVDALTAEPDPSFPPDWEAQLETWATPAPTDIFELVFTSGTTGTPKGVMLAHDNVVASIASFHRIVPQMEHRIVSLLPAVASPRAGGWAVLRAVGRRRHPVRAQPEPAGDLRCAARPSGDLDGRRPAGPRPVLERHRARGREARPRDGLQQASCDRAPPADVPATAAVRERPQAARRPFPPVPVGRSVPAARPPAGLGGPRGDGPPGLRHHRDGDRQLHEARRSRARDGRAPTGRRRDADRRRR